MSAIQPFQPRGESRATGILTQIAIICIGLALGMVILGGIFAFALHDTRFVSVFGGVAGLILLLSAVLALISIPFDANRTKTDEAGVRAWIAATYPGVFTDAQGVALAAGEVVHINDNGTERDRVALVYRADLGGQVLEFTRESTPRLTPQSSGA